MTNREKMIEGMKLLKEGCKNIPDCNEVDCPIYEHCYGSFECPPCDWIIEEDE